MQQLYRLAASRCTGQHEALRASQLHFFLPRLGWRASRWARRRGPQAKLGPAQAGLRKVLAARLLFDGRSLASHARPKRPPAEHLALRGMSGVPSSRAYQA